MAEPHGGKREASGPAEGGGGGGGGGQKRGKWFKRGPRSGPWQSEGVPRGQPGVLVTAACGCERRAAREVIGELLDVCGPRPRPCSP